MGRDLIPTHGIFSANSTMEGSMPDSLFSREFQSVFSQVRDTGGTPKAFPSPIDWRDQGIYFLMVDRFNNTPQHPATSPSTIRLTSVFKGNFVGTQDQLAYIKGARCGSHLAQPRSQECAFGGRHLPRVRHPSLFACRSALCQRSLTCR